MNALARKAGFVVLMLTLLALLAGCRHNSAASLSGTYASPDGQQFLAFHNDGTVQLHIGSQELTTRYAITGDNVEITSLKGAGAGANVHLKIDANGCLYSDSAGIDSHQHVCKNK